MGRKKAVTERFARWLDITMANNHITGRELATQLHVHDSVVSRWRSGEGTPTVENCGRLAEALDVDPLRLAVTAGVLDAHMAGVEPLPLPPATALRERVRDQIYQIRGLTERSRTALLEAFDETMEGTNAHA